MNDKRFKRAMCGGYICANDIVERSCHSTSCVAGTNANGYEDFKTSGIESRNNHVTPTRVMVGRQRSVSTPNTLDLSMSQLVNAKDTFQTMGRQSLTPKRIQDLKRPQFMQLTNSTANGCTGNGNIHPHRKLTKRKSTSSQNSAKSEDSPSSPNTPPIIIEPPLITTELVKDTISCAAGQVEFDHSDSDDFEETDFADLDDSFDCNIRHSWPSGRTVRTAPSTPGGDNKTIVPQHGYSTTNLEKKRSSKGIYDDSETQGKALKDTRSKIKSRNEKFHKLFKNPSPDEICRKCYSCAYLGDILIQGYLYISPHWFCFYSKILGREKRIEIHVSEVIKITREKVAIIIPNAIGILTPEDKYVFGSLITRDKVYQHLTTLLWRHREPNTKDGPNNEESDGNDEEDTGIVIDADNNNDVKPSISLDCSSSEASVCMHCGIAIQDHQPGECNESIQPESSHTTNQTFSLPPTPTQKPSRVSTSSAPPSVKVSKVKGLVNSVQTNNWFMILFSVMVCILVVSALVMSYKIVLLQARLDVCHKPYQEDSYDGMYSNIYYLNDHLHAATVQRFYSVIQANINVLDQMYQTLKSLEESTLTHSQETGT